MSIVKRARTEEKEHYLNSKDTIDQLYRSDHIQCQNCGLRCDKTEIGDHLDWHFLSNRADKKVVSRKWYETRGDWDLSNHLMEANHTAACTENKHCPVCLENFDQFYNQVFF